MRKKTGKDLHIKLTPQERAALEARAKEMNQTLTNCVITLTLARPIQFPDIVQRMDKIIYEVNRIGNNINQIAKHENAGIFYPEDIQTLLQFRIELESQVLQLREALMTPGEIHGDH